MNLTSIIVFIFIVAAALYEFVIRRRKCEEKIMVHIENNGGVTISIKRLSQREEIYNVKYKKEDNYYNAIVKFNFFYKEEWSD